MDVTPLVQTGQQIIQSYKDGRFRVSGSVHSGPVIVYPDETLSWVCADSANALTDEDFQPIAARAKEIDVVLLGCGPTIQFLPAQIKKALKDQGLNVEVMDTGAACRTYNVLMAEGRRVVAALLPI